MTIAVPRRGLRQLVRHFDQRAVEPLAPSIRFDCAGGVLTQVTDENSNTSSASYTDAYFWRPHSTTDQSGNTTTFSYPNPNQTESTLAFNSSVSDALTTVDGLGRPIFSQTKQGPSASTYDTVASCYDALGRATFASMPYSAVVATSTTSCPGGAGTTTAYDALGRATSVTDGGGGSVSYSYTKNDVYQILGPAPTGENTKRKQSEYNGLGQLTSVCEVLAPPAPALAHKTARNRPAIGPSTAMMLWAISPEFSRTFKAAPTQTRTYAYDMLGRLTSESNPESGTDDLLLRLRHLGYNCRNSPPVTWLPRPMPMETAVCYHGDAFTGY